MLVSDLAFSEMDFLSHSKNKPAAVDKELVTSKHSQKIQRERERTRTEISNYFAPRKPLQDVEPDRQNRRNLVMPSERGTAKAASSDVGGTSHFVHGSPYKQPSNLKDQYLGFGTNISSSRKFSLPPPQYEPIYVRPSVETERSGSISSASYVSWSETVKSASRRGSSTRGMSNKGLSSISSSPSVLRRRLVESGMLDGLGLYSNPRSMRQASTRGETPSRGDLSRQHSSYCQPSRLEIDAGDPSSPFYQQARDPQQNLPHGHDQLRRQQIEAARRALLPPAPAVHQDGHNVDSTRHTLAARAYLRPPPSSVPRRPATTTPIRQSSQNRVLSRSSLQHEMRRDPEAIDASAQPSEDLSHYGMNRGGPEREDYGAHHLDVPSHIRISVYGDNSHGQQLWAQKPMDTIAHEQMSEIEFDDMIEPQGEYCFQDNRDNHCDQDFVIEQTEQVDLPFEQPDYQENNHQEDQFEQPVEQLYYPEATHEEEMSMTELNDYDQPPPEPDPMNRYFQTPRGKSYFQQESFERPIPQDDAHGTGLLEEDQLKGFWALKRW